MSETVRVLRILEYVGTREFVEKTLERGGVPANGEHVVEGKGRIKSSLVGSFPEIVVSDAEG